MLATEARAFMGTCATLQRVRTARARLVLLMLLENEGDFVQLA